MRAHAEFVHVGLADEGAAAGPELADDGGFERGLVGEEEGRGACCWGVEGGDVVFYGELEGGGGGLEFWRDCCAVYLVFRSWRERTGDMVVLEGRGHTLMDEVVRGECAPLSEGKGGGSA